MSNAMVDALGMCFSHIPLLVWLIASSDKSYIRIGKSVHISAWASMLLVQQSWAMRRPQSVGRVTRRSHAFRLIYACFYGISEVSKKGLNMSTLKQAKKHLQDVINQQVDATVCPLDDAKIHAAIVDYMLAALSEGDDGVANEKCGDELTKLFEGKLGEAALTSFVARIDSVYDTVRTICYLSDKGDGPLGWNNLNN